MPLVTKDLGQVAAVFLGTSAPTNPALLWYNTNNGLFYYYNLSMSTWQLLGTSSVQTVSTTAGIVASSTTPPSLITTYNRVDTVPTNNAKVQIGIHAVIGAVINISNNDLTSGNALQILPNGSDVFDGGSNFILQSGNNSKFVCYINGFWTLEI